MPIARKVQIKVVALPLIHSVGKICLMYSTLSLNDTFCARIKTLSHHGKSNIPAKQQVSPLIPWEALTKELQCCMATVSMISLPSSAKQISVGREEFAYSPEHVFAFVLENQQTAG